MLQKVSRSENKELQHPIDTRAADAESQSIARICRRVHYRLHALNDVSAPRAIECPTRHGAARLQELIGVVSERRQNIRVHKVGYGGLAQLVLRPGSNVAGAFPLSLSCHVHIILPSQHPAGAVLNSLGSHDVGQEWRIASETALSHRGIIGIKLDQDGVAL